MKTDITLTMGTISLVVLFGAILCGQQPKPAGKDAETRTAPASAQVWRSITTGREYRVWTEKDRLYAEWANVPPHLVQHGAYIRSEGRRVGSKWVGTSKIYRPCEMEESNKRVRNWCLLQTRIEFDTVTPDRITGRGESLRRFDCAACKVLETGWADFVWEPKASGQ